MKDGHPGEQEDRRVEHIIPPQAVKRGIYEIVIEVTANGMFGLGPYRYQTPDVRPSSILPPFLISPFSSFLTLSSFLPTSLTVHLDLHVARYRLPTAKPLFPPSLRRHHPSQPTRPSPQNRFSNPNRTSPTRSS